MTAPAPQTALRAHPRPAATESPRLRRGWRRPCQQQRSDSQSPAGTNAAGLGHGEASRPGAGRALTAGRALCPAPPRCRRAASARLKSRTAAYATRNGERNRYVASTASRARSRPTREAAASRWRKAMNSSSRPGEEWCWARRNWETRRARDSWSVVTLRAALRRRAWGPLGAACRGGGLGHQRGGGRRGEDGETAEGGLERERAGHERAGQDRTGHATPTKKCEVWRPRSGAERHQTPCQGGRSLESKAGRGASLRRSHLSDNCGRGSC